MPEARPLDLHVRLDRLEHANRRLRRLVVALGACGALLVGTSMRPRTEGVLEGTGLRLVDATGRVRLEARADDDDDARITLRGPDGGARVVLTSGTEEGLWLFDATGVERVALVAGDDQGLYLRDAEGRDRLGLVTTEQDEGLYFVDDRGLYVVERDGESAVHLATGATRR